jgi:phage replication-related protein YjqB (UPF0714/DUF867 family)
MDTYRSYDDLCVHEREGSDFQVVFRRGSPEVVVMAIHGGGIEPGTADIADAVAGDDYTLYCFKGIKPAGNRVLHVTANRFDEPRAAAAAAMAETVMAIHGCRGSQPVAYVGGLDLELARRIRDALRSAGFDARRSRRPGLLGADPANICNRCHSGRGVQLELTARLRRGLFDTLDHRPARRRTRLFFRFVAALREALAAEEARRPTQP